jgi:Starch-binding associating with outer membrane
MKNFLKYTVCLILGMAGLLTFPACERNFLDINTDPNNPTDVPLNQLLPYAQLSMSNAMTLSSFGISDPLMSFSHQIVVRSNYNNYFAVGDDPNVNDPWQQLYGVSLTDIRQIISKGTATNSWHYVGVAQIMKAFSFSVLVDLWGNVPYTEANVGAASPYPKFDKGEDIYKDLFRLIDEGIANLGKTSAVALGTADLFYGGNTDSWIRFANSLKLRLYNQVRLTPLYNDSAVKALISGGKLISAANQDFEMLYGTGVSPDNRHPGYEDEYTQGAPAYYVSPYFHQILQGKSKLNPIFDGIEDPRIPYYYYNQLRKNQAPQNPSSYKDGEFLSIWFSSSNIDPNADWDQNTSQTVMGLYPIGGKFDNGAGGAITATSGTAGAGLMRILPYFNTLYTRAELALTKATGDDAEAMLKSAITESFAEVNRAAASVSAPAISTAAIDAYIGKIMALYTAGNQSKKLEIILTQKWIANFGWGLDSYNDTRRTTFPKLFDPLADDNVNTVLARQYILSFPYPVSDLQINPNAPEQKNIYTEKVFWAQ